MKPINARLQGELFVRALELFSLYLQRNDACLHRMAAELSDAELRVIIRQVSGFYHHLTGGPQ